MIIWGCNFYVVNSKDGKKSLEPRTFTYPRTVVGPLIIDNITHQADGYFMCYSNIIHLLIKYDPHTDKVKVINNAYFDEHDILIHPK